MKRKPSTRQVIAEKIVLIVNNLIDSSMGKGNSIFAPYIAALFTFSILSSLAGLVSLRPPTADFNLTLTWALITFFMIQYNGIKYGGIKGYLKSFFEPFAWMFPLNVMSVVSTPVSLSFRHFGNIAAGTLITQLIYSSLAAASGLIPLIGKHIPILQIGLPAIFSIYFDLFSSLIQAFIFISLTMAFVGSARKTTLYN